jgi:hypothetical protein
LAPGAPSPGSWSENPDINEARSHSGPCDPGLTCDPHVLDDSVSDPANRISDLSSALWPSRAALRAAHLAVNRSRRVVSTPAASLMSQPFTTIAGRSGRFIQAPRRGSRLIFLRIFKEMPLHRVRSPRPDRCRPTSTCSALAVLTASTVLSASCAAAIARRLRSWGSSRFKVSRV